MLSESEINDPFKEFLLRYDIKHYKIPLYSAWVGAIYERLIRVIKSSLHKTMGRKRYEYFDLITLLSEVQNSVNSRPLTYRDTDDHNFQVISPNSFLKLDPGRALELGAVCGDEIQAPTRRQLVAALETRSDLMDQFRERFYTEYLLSLRESGQRLYEQEWSTKVKEDEIVLLSLPGKTRPFWQLCRVQKLLPGQDGKVRFVQLIKPDRTEVVHSLTHVYPLEISLLPEHGDETTVSSPEIGGNSNPERPKRRAALECLERLKRNA